MNTNTGELGELSALQQLADDPADVVPIPKDLERQAIWQEWLAGRLTLLANLKHYLEMEPGEHNDLPWDEMPEEEAGA